MPSCTAHWPSAACGYGGTCNTSLGTCECNEGFLSRGDFFLQDGYDCVVPKAAISAIYVVSVVLATFNLTRRVLAIRRVLIEQRSKGTNQATAQQSKVITHLHGLSLVLCVLQMISSIVFLALEDAFIGENLTKTILHILSAFMCYYCIFEMCAFFAETTAQITASLRLNIPWVRRFVSLTRPPYLAICIVACIVAPVGMLAQPSSMIWTYMHLGGTQTLCAYLLALIYASTSKFTALLDFTSSTACHDANFVKTTQALRNRILVIRRVGFMVNLSCQGGIGFMVFWPWARAFVPLQVAALLLGSVAVETLLFHVLDKRPTRSRARHWYHRSLRAIAPSTHTTSDDHDKVLGLSTSPDASDGMPPKSSQTSQSK